MPWMTTPLYTHDGWGTRCRSEGCHRMYFCRGARCRVGPGYANLPGFHHGHEIRFGFYRATALSLAPDSHNLCHMAQASGWYPAAYKVCPSPTTSHMLTYKPPAFCADNPRVCTTSGITARAVMAVLIKCGCLDMHHARFAIRMSLVEIEIGSRTQGSMGWKKWQVMNPSYYTTLNCRSR